MLLGKGLVFFRSHHGPLESFPCRLAEWRGELARLGLGQGKLAGQFANTRFQKFRHAAMNPNGKFPVAPFHGHPVHNIKLAIDPYVEQLATHGEVEGDFLVELDGSLDDARLRIDFLATGTVKSLHGG